MCTVVVCSSLIGSSQLLSLVVIDCAPGRRKKEEASEVRRCEHTYIGRGLEIPREARRCLISFSLSFPLVVTLVSRCYMSTFCCIWSLFFVHHGRLGNFTRQRGSEGGNALLLRGMQGPVG